MKKILDMKKMGALALGLMAFAPAAMAQDEVETSSGADIVSQYYWRGQDLGAVPCSLPWVSDIKVYLLLLGEV